MIKMITYGNREGLYFTEWRFKLLKELFDYIKLGTFRTLYLTDVNIYYDSKEDFHHLDFCCNGHHVNVRLYKVFGVTIDGTKHNGTWLKSEIINFSNFILKKLDE
jgi:hypothetical protein